MPITGNIVGYDPGGNNNHGVASLIVNNDEPIKISFKTIRNAQAALRWLTKDGVPIAAGIDTLTVLSMGDSGWRPADSWLRSNYPEVKNSVVNPNYLQGAMSLNGLSMISSLRSLSNDILISETHPKVLYYHLTESKYNYQENRELMNANLSKWLGLEVNTFKEHEWDAAISCFAVWQGISGRWKKDLHQLQPEKDERLVYISGASYFFWP